MKSILGYSDFGRKGPLTVRFQGASHIFKPPESSHEGEKVILPTHHPQYDFPDHRHWFPGVGIYGNVGLGAGG